MSQQYSTENVPPSDFFTIAIVLNVLVFGCYYLFGFEVAVLVALLQMAVPLNTYL